MNDFGDVLKRLRNQRGKSQSKLGEAAGFDHSYISRLEMGARHPTRDAIHNIADALDFERPSKDRDLLLAAAGFIPESYRLTPRGSLVQIGVQLRQVRDLLERLEQTVALLASE